MVVIIKPSNTVQFQYYWNFSKCIRAIFSQLSFENFWLYLLGEVVMTQNYYKSVYQKSKLSYQMHSKILRQFSKGSL